jgi:hypothetical protein
MNELVNILKGVAPALATAVAGPLGGAAISAIASKFGVADEVTAVAQAIAGDPHAAQKLQELEMEYAKLELEDRKDARAMQVAALQQDDLVAKRFVYYYAWFWSISSMAYFSAVTFIPLPEGGQHFADIVLGFLLGTAVATIISYFYGSSKSSKDKTEALTKGVR